MKRILAAVVTLIPLIAIVFWLLHSMVPPMTFAVRSHGPEGANLKAVSSITRSPDGSVVLTVSDNKKLQLWDSSTGTSLREIESAGNEWLSSPSFAPDGSSFAAVDSVSEFRQQVGKVVFWNAQTGERVATIENIDWPHTVKINASGTWAAVGGNPDLYLLDIATHQVIATAAKAHTNGPAQAIDFSPSGDLLATAGRDGLVKLWHLPDLRPVRSFSVAETVRPRRPSEGPVTVAAISVAFSHDGATLAAATTEDSVYFWDVQTGKEMEKYLASEPLPDHSFPSGLANALAFTADDEWVLTTDPAGTALCLLSPRSHKEYSTAISTGSDARIVAMDSSASDGSVAIAYREYHPGVSGPPSSKFSIWSLASTSK